MKRKRLFVGTVIGSADFGGEYFRVRWEGTGCDYSWVPVSAVSKQSKTRRKPKPEGGVR